MKTPVATLGPLSVPDSPPGGLGPVTVTVNIEGVQKTGTNYVDISGTYANGSMTYTIAPYSTAGNPPNNLARIEAGDGDPEFLWLRNVKITATSNSVDNGHIFFYALFDEPPKTNIDPLKKVSIERSASGSFAPAVIGNWINVTGWAQHDPVNPNPPDGESGNWEEIIQPDIHVVISSTSATFNNLTRTRTWDPAQGHTFTGQHVLQGELWFKLENNGNKLQFTNDTAKGLKIRSITQSDVA